MLPKRRIYELSVFSGFILLAGLLIREPYYQNVLIFIGIHAILTVGLNLLMGYAGQISLGHAAFFGIGAYSSGILTATHGWSPLSAMLVAVIVTAVIAVIIGIPSLKLTGYYLAMATLGFGIIVYIMFREMSQFTGGASGLVGIPPLSFGKWTLGTGTDYFFFVWGLLFVVIVLSLNMVDSQVGRAFRAIHDSEIAALSLGIDTSRLKLKVFVISAVYASIAGSIYAHYITFISPSSFGFMFSIKLVTMVVIGGMASIWGALFGAATITILPEILHVFAEYDVIVFGIILIVVMIFMPQGLTCGILDAWQKSKRLARKRALMEQKARL
ncbi:MAG: branched-chain amino acid ABC transporter permease [Deltaproteobacteria bacterium]|nr:MAG: branched-chain amino acid ABC transporter permease [Deltaproteobacteria bacterium]